MAKKKQVMKKGGMAKKRGGGMIKKRGGRMMQKKMGGGMMMKKPMMKVGGDVKKIEKAFGSKKKKQLAVALNFKLVCKSKWRSTKIKQNDKIEIVSAFTGG